MDYYAILGVERGAPHDDVKGAYRRLARRLHPDKNFGAPRDVVAANEKRFADVTVAWEVLGDAERRSAYDRGVATRDKIAKEVESAATQSILVMFEDVLKSLTPMQVETADVTALLRRSVAQGEIAVEKSKADAISALSAYKKLLRRMKADPIFFGYIRQQRQKHVAALLVYRRQRLVVARMHELIADMEFSGDPVAARNFSLSLDGPNQAQFATGSVFNGNTFYQTPKS